MDVCNLLRASLIFIIDDLFQNRFGLTAFTDAIFPVNNISTNVTLNQNEISESSLHYQAIFLLFVKIIASGLVFCSTLCLYVLPARYLFLIYSHIVSVCILLMSYWANIQSLKVLSRKYENFESYFMFEVMTLDFNRIVNFSTQLQVVDFLCIFFRNIILQYFLSLVFGFLQVFTTNDPVHKIFRLSFIIPTLIVLVPATHGILNTIVVLTTLLPLFVKFKTLWLINTFSVTDLIHDCCYHVKETLNNYGLNTFIQMEWNRLNIPNVLRIFWTYRVVEQFLYLLTDNEIKNETVYDVVKYLLIKGCDTCIAILGLTSIISYFCHYVGTFLQWVLLSNNVNGNRMSMMSAVLFITLALQTGLTSLEPEKRFVRLFKNVCLLCAALLYYVHYGVDILLLSLSTSHNSSLNRHLRALIVCAFLILLPITMLKYLLTYNSINSWVIILSAFLIEIIIRVLLSLAIYSLYLIDAHRQTFWERLDDYVYYLTLFGNIVKYCFGIIVFLDSVYHIISGSGGVVYSIMICMHGYLKLWCVARNGWRAFTKRRNAAKKIEVLPNATSNQLANLNDVCSICHQNMVSAKITQCNHYFHAVCLRKWVHLKDQCPLCQAIF